MTTLRPISNVKFIYKVCDNGLWDVAKRAGKFIGAEIDLQDGYIHFSTASQLRDTLVRHFAGRNDLILLKIDIRDLDIIWESGREGELFPHLYEHLPLDSVIAEYQLDISADGYHIVPEACL